MKVSINSQFLAGPYGGGIQFANYFHEFLIGKGVTVVNHLRDNDIDVILHVNPFPFLTRTASAYSFLQAYAYKLTHPKTVIILRVNECDERKGTTYMNGLLRSAASYSDHVVFIASWLKKLLTLEGKVILNGADERIFNIHHKRFWDGKEKLKIVTHHWSSNANKGHEAYQKIDALLNRAEFADKFEFTYVGAYPENLQYKNTKLVSALSGKELAEELKKHHVYITATINEPGGMHHIEGALCGLPLLYINSGALPEYCTGFGIEFNINSLEEKLMQMYDEYPRHKVAMEKYSNTASRMAGEYLHFIEKSYAARESAALKGRRPVSAILLRFYDLVNTAWWRIQRMLHII